MLDSRVVRIGRCYDRTYATNIGARYAAGCGVLQPCVRSSNIRMLEVMRMMCKKKKRSMVPWSPRYQNFQWLARVHPSALQNFVAVPTMYVRKGATYVLIIWARIHNIIMVVSPLNSGARKIRGEPDLTSRNNISMPCKPEL